MKNRRLNVLRRIKKYSSRSKGSVAALVIVSALSIPVMFISPQFFQILVDDVMKAREIQKIGIVVIGLLSVYAVRFVLDAIDLFCSNRLLNRFSLSLRNDVWSTIFRLPFAEYEKRDVGDLKMRLFDDVDSLGNFIKDQIVEVVANCLIVAVAVVLIFRINVKMSLFCLSILPFVFLINHLIGAGQKKVNEDIRKVSEDYYTFEYNSLQFWKEVKVQCAGEAFVGRFHRYRQVLAKLGVRNIRYWFYTEVFSDFKANYLTNVVVYIVGAFFVIKGNFSVGVLVMYAEYFSMLFTSIDTVNQKNVALKTSLPYYKRVFELLDAGAEYHPAAKKAALKEGISVENVCYRYRPEQNNVLDHMDFRLRAGEYAAVIGKSGCGKTTLIKLLLGISEPQQGRVTIDGIPLDECDKSDLYRQTGVVMQDNMLFNVTIRENLLLANQNASQDELEEACRQANILAFIQGLPAQFETVIGERGVLLSGGQKQRLLIAQAILKKPRLLIFDEATSALDKLSEDVIDRSLHELAKAEHGELTILVISHKPSAVLRADRTFVMENGRIADEGTYGELIARNRLYREIAESGTAKIQKRKGA